MLKEQFFERFNSRPVEEELNIRSEVARKIFENRSWSEIDKNYLVKEDLSLIKVISHNHNVEIVFKVESNSRDRVIELHEIDDEFEIEEFEKLRLLEEESYNLSGEGFKLFFKDEIFGLEVPKFFDRQDPAKEFKSKLFLGRMPNDIKCEKSLL